MEQSPGVKRWPVPVWLLQLVPAALLLGGALWRIGPGGAAATPAWFGAVAAGTLWMAAGIAPLFSRRMRRWVMVRRYDWLLFGGAAVLGVVMLDVGLTVTGVVPSLADQRRQSLNYTVGRYSEYRLVPGTVATDQGSDIVVNGRGLRGPGPAGDRSAATRILFLGGSQVFDYHGTGGGWPARVGVELARLGHDVDILNAAVPGYNSTDTLRAYLTDLWLLEPDIVFLCHGWNDIKYFRRMADGTPYRGPPPSEPVSWDKDWRLYPRGLDRLLTASAFYRRIRVGLIETMVTEEGYDARGDGGPTRIDGKTDWPGRAGPRQFRLNLELAADLAEQTGARLVLCRQAHADLANPSAKVAGYASRNTRLSVAEVATAMAVCQDVAAEVAAGRGLTLVDMHSGLSGRPENFRDAIHLSEEGSGAAAALVAAALRGSELTRSGDN